MGIEEIIITITNGGAIVTAVATTAATTATISATNASMNADGNLVGSLDDVGKTTLKDTTSKEAVKNYAIAAVIAGVSAWAVQASGGTAAGSNAGAASNTATAANTTVYVNPGLSNATVLTSNTANSSSFFTNLGNATVKIGAATGSNILATSAIKGQSINEVIAAQGGVDRVILNSALQIVGEAGAMQIGNAAHTGQITQGQQITLHAALGCGIGAGMSGGGSGCASGAAAGVIGELTANSLYQGETGNFGSTNQARRIAVVVGGLSGAAASLFTSIAIGDEDDKTAKNIYAGNFLGTNAAANNALQIMAQKVPPSDKSHLTIVHTPEPNEQVLYAGKEGYVQDKTSGLWTRTWGAGPDLNLSELQIKLVSDNNRSRDVDLSIKTYQSPNLVPINQETYYTNLLNQLDQNYQDNLKYDLFPNSSNPTGYNSNSYISGLLNAANINQPQINNLTLPGYKKPIPVENFGVR